MKKLLAVIITAAMICSLSVGVSAQECISFNAVRFGVGLTSDKTYFRNYSLDFETKMLSAFSSFTATVNLTGMKISKNDIQGMYETLLHNHPEYWYVTGNIPSAYMSGGYITTMTLQYCASASQIQTMQTKFNARVEYILSFVNNDMTDLQKAITIHDYLVAQCDYDEAGSANTSDANAYSAYGCIVEKECVCQGYSDAYKLILNKLGIDCYLVVSVVMGHAWNMIKLDGEYYHIDLTWDDGSFSAQGSIFDVSGYVKHTYFLLTDAQMESLSHNDWYLASGEDFVADSSLYNTAAWKTGITSCVYTVGDYMYYISGKDFVRYNTVNNTTDTVYTVEDYMISGDDIKLTYTNGFFYFNGENNDIFCYDVASDLVSRVFETKETDRICGLVYNDSEITYDLYNNITFTLRTSTGIMSHTKIGDCNGDDSVNAKDLLSIRKSMVGWDVIFYTSLSDTNKDGIVNCKDVLMLRKFIAGIVTEL